MENATHQLARRSFFAMLPALLTACSAVDVLNATVATDTYRRVGDQAYGSDARQWLDVDQPRAEVKNAPLVVFFYGGSWSSGERADYQTVSLER